ncbi:hypothetical protein Agub_g10220 [Astrephomene gubernaculifera]|uniref:CBS domain-containing protein n=1 Tax=Astrephomene gubernaculifera TaxID=47775 RepID=A0AAD3HNV9_9CHLO|nr:hypothetical protein Agub_g10220 [Astrephomene gubernaculifera]
MGLSEAITAAAEALSRQPLSSIIPKQQNIVCLEHNSSVSQALQLLARRHILSAPLVVMPGLEDMESGSGEPPNSAPQLIGWVTVESLLRAFLAHMGEKYGKPLPRKLLLLMTMLEKEGPAFAEKLLITLTGSEDRGLLFQVHADVSLMTALRESFVPPGKPAAHRLAVFDASGAITSVVSQLDVIRFLRDHPQLLGELGSATVGQLGWAHPPAATTASAASPGASAAPSTPATAAGAASSPAAKPDTAAASAPSPTHGSSATRGSLVTVEASLPVLLAYERMVRAGVSGAPVVADSEAAIVGSGGGAAAMTSSPSSGAAGGGGGGSVGGMIANLSMSDLRNIQSQHFGILALPVGEFLALLHNTSYLGYSQRTSTQATHPFFASGPPSVMPPPHSPRLGRRHGGLHSHSLSPHRAPSASSASVSSLGGAMETGEATASESEGRGGASASGMDLERDDDVELEIRMITCTANTTFLQLLSLLSDNKVHRVYVVEAAGRAGGGQHGVARPIGVITPTDILRLLAAPATADKE